MMELPPPIVVCRACAREMPRFRFRCDDCGAWDSAVTLDGHTHRQVGARDRPASGAREPEARARRAEA